jgi:hypothetical protein
MPRKVKSPRRKNVKKNKKQKRSKASRRRKQKKGGAFNDDLMKFSPRTYTDRVAKAFESRSGDDLSPRTLAEYGLDVSPHSPTLSEQMKASHHSRPSSSSLRELAELAELEKLEAEVDEQILDEDLSNAGWTPRARLKSLSKRYSVRDLYDGQSPPSSRELSPRELGELMDMNKLKLDELKKYSPRPSSTSSDEYVFVLPEPVLVPREVQQSSGLFSRLFSKRSKRSAPRK